MIDRVEAIKNSHTVVCQYIYTNSDAVMKFRCDHCRRGVVYVWCGDDRQGVMQDRKKCAVCSAKFLVKEILR